MTRRILLLMALTSYSLSGGILAAQERVIPLDTVRASASSRAATELASATRAVEVITAEQIRRSPARSVAEVLQWAFGVDLMARSPALADVAIRGSSFEQVLVMVDGVRVSDPQTGHFDLNLAVPLDQVERVEVLRGPASTLHGADAVGGVINVVTRREGAGVSARAEAGAFGTTALALSGAFGGDGVRADIAGDLRQSDGHRPGTDYQTGQVRAALEVPLAGQALRADLAYAARDFGADGFYAPFPSYEETRTTTATLGLNADPDVRFAIEPLLSLRRHGDDFILKREDPAYYRNMHTTWQLGGEVMARYAVAPGLSLAGGVEAYEDRLESESLGDRTERRAAVLAEVAAGELGRWTGAAGVRADWHTELGTFWSPSLSAAWWPRQGLRLRGSAGRSFRAPTFTERFYRSPANIGDPELDPERAWSGEVGVDTYLLPGVRLGMAGFVRHADALIDWARPLDVAAEAPWYARNVTGARFRGLETELALEDVLGIRWTARGSWLSVRSTDAEGYTSKYALRPLVETFSLTANRAFRNGLDLSVRTHRTRRVGEDAALRMDARLAYALSRYRAYLDLRNLGDAAYPDITGADAPGRAVYLGMEWRGMR